VNSFFNYCTLAGLSLLALASDATAATFRGVGFASSVPTAQGSLAYAVSADGSTTVGDSDGAFRWTAATGIAGLGAAPGLANGPAAGVSPNGATIAGWADTSDGYNVGAFYWTASTGSVALGNPSGFTNSRAFAVSGNGQIVGEGSTDINFDTSEAFQWTSGGGFSMLPSLPGATVSVAVGISADGTTVAGTNLSSSGYQAVVWKNGGAPTVLPPMPFGSSAQTLGISADGLAIVGWGVTGFSEENAFVWTAAGGTKLLGPTVAMSQAFAASDNGAIVVGQWDLPSQWNAFIWDKADGMRSLQSVLVSAGLDQALAGWTLTEATGISADGTVIVGFGTDPQGHTEGWVATVPEPSTLILAALGGLALLAYRPCRH